MEFVKIQFLPEPIIVFNVLEKLRNKKNEVRTAFEFFGKIDSALSIASLRCGLSKFRVPVISENIRHLQFKNIYHPQIPACIANSMSVDEKSILLTGSNMSGKTTFIRSVGINALTAQTINTCFAEEFRSPPMKILSAIRISDDAMSGRSCYLMKY